MKSGKEIVEMWLKEFRFELGCTAKDFLIEAIEHGLMEAYKEGQQAHEEQRL